MSVVHQACDVTSESEVTPSKKQKPKKEVPEMCMNTLSFHHSRSGWNRSSLGAGTFDLMRNRFLATCIVPCWWPCSGKTEKNIAIRARKVDKDLSFVTHVFRDHCDILIWHTNGKMPYQIYTPNKGFQVFILKFWLKFSLWEYNYRTYVKEQHGPILSETR